MHEALFKYINERSTTQLSANDKKLLKDYFTPQHLRKKDHFLKEGDVCRYKGFIVKGAMRQYSSDERAKEHILNFYVENWWPSNRESYFTGTISETTIDAWEDTDLLVLDRQHLELVEEIEAVKKLKVYLDENMAAAYQKRTLASISLPADLRYKDITIRYPEFVERFPQHMIASYLGITKETLSRIRRKLDDHGL